MIHRKILKVKTTGSRVTRDLRPILTDVIPKGVNLTVHEYNEDEGWCVCEISGSDHPVLPPEEQITTAKIDEVLRHESVIEELETHPLSPPIIMILSTSVHDSVDAEKKEIVVRGRKGSFIRKERVIDEGGLEIDYYILDEG